MIKVSLIRRRIQNRILLWMSCCLFILMILVGVIPLNGYYQNILMNTFGVSAIVGLVLSVIFKSHSQIGEIAFLDNEIQINTSKISEKIDLTEILQMRVMMIHYRGRQVGIRIIADDGMDNEFSIETVDKEHKFYFSIDSREKWSALKSKLNRWSDINNRITVVA
jgi:hypothetical protein